MEALMQFIKKLKQKTPYLVVGVLWEKIIFNSFDYILYPYMIWRQGPVKGGIIMSVLSIAICYATMALYDLTKKDWFGIEWIKEARDYSGSRKFLRMMSWALNKGRVAAIIFLSVYTNPFTTTAYMREGASKFQGMTKRDWKIFFISWFIGNLEWILILSGLVSVFKNLYNFVVNLVH